MIQIDLMSNHPLIIKEKHGKDTSAKRLVQIKMRLKTEIDQSIITKRGESIGGRSEGYYLPSISFTQESYNLAPKVPEIILSILSAFFLIVHQL